MSSAPPHINVPHDASKLPVTLPMLSEKKRLGEPIVMVTAYDFPSARAAERRASTSSSSAIPAR